MTDDVTPDDLLGTKPRTAAGRQLLERLVGTVDPTHRWTRWVLAIEVEAAAAAAEREQAARERLREALRELQSAQRDYRWLVHPREHDGTCRLCGATEGQHHDSGHECGRLYDADHLADRALASPDVSAREAVPLLRDWLGWALTLAADIRAVDGNHDMGAGALAEALARRGWRLSTPPASSETPGEAQG